MTGTRDYAGYWLPGRWIAFVVAFMAIALIACACGSGKGSGGGPVAGPDEVNTGVFGLPSPETIKTLKYTREGLFHFGSEIQSALDPMTRNVSVKGNGLVFRPNWQENNPSLDGLAMATYLFDLSGYNMSDQVTVYWRGRGAGGSAFLGIPDYPRNTWQWLDVSGTGTVECDFTNALTSSGNLVAVLVVTGTANWELGSIRAGNVPYYVTGNLIDIKDEGFLDAEVLLNGPTRVVVPTGGFNSWEIANVPPGIYRISPQSLRYEFTPAEMEVELYGGDQLVGAFIANVAFLQQITCTVNRQDNGGGLKTVQITASRISGVGGSLTVKTDNMGVAELALPDGTFIIEPKLKGWVFDPPACEITVEGSAVDVPAFTAMEAPGVSIHGKVIDGSDESGLVYRIVHLVGANHVTRTTDNEGNFTFPNVEDGSYVVYPEVYGYGITPVTISITVTGSDLTLEPFVGTRTLFQVTGRVVSEVDGSPFSGVRVVISGEGFDTVSSHTTEDGYYTLTGAAGDCHLSFHDSRYVFNNEYIDVEITGDTELPDAVASPSPEYTISGQAFLEDGVTPLALVEVGAHTVETPTLYQSTFTDSEGRYTLEESTVGRHVIMFSLTGYEFDPVRVFVDVTNGDIEADPVIAEAIPSFKVSGYIFESGTAIPAPGTTVHLYSSVFNYSAISDASGYWECTGVLPREYLVVPVFAGARFMPAYIELGYVNEDVLCPVMAREMITGGFEVVGTVLDKNSGTPIQYALVHCQDTDGVIPAMYLVTDGLGQFAATFPDMTSWEITPEYGIWVSEPASRTVEINGAGVGLDPFLMYNPLAPPPGT